MLVIDPMEHTAAIMLRKGFEELNLKVFAPEDITPENAPKVVAVFTTSTQSVPGLAHLVKQDENFEAPSWVPPEARRIVTGQFTELFFSKVKARMLGDIVALAEPLMAFETMRAAE